MQQKWKFVKCEHIITKKSVTFFSSRICGEIGESRLISSTVDEAMLVALGVEVMRHNRNKIRKMQHSVYVQLLAKAFPDLQCAVYLWLCM